MGKKKNSRRAPPANYADTPTAGTAEEDPDFAEKLLSSMSVDSQQPSGSEKMQETVSEVAVEDADEGPQDADDGRPDFETRHPHLHSIHKSLSKVFRRDSSKSRSSSRAGSRSRSRSASRNSRGSASSSGSATDQLNALTLSDNSGEATLPPENSSVSGAAGETENAPGKKRNRRKEKLAERERERARIVQEAQAEAESIPDKRKIELKGMGMAISKAGLVEYEVQPDGHCLFHALCDQLELRRNVKVSVQELRSTLADYIRKHPDDFVPYLVADESGDVLDIDKYTDELENTPLWGGELEIMAASRNYGVPVRVYFASQAPLDVNLEVFTGVSPLHLAYYQAKFGLGAHYNSLRDAEPLK